MKKYCLVLLVAGKLSEVKKYCISFDDYSSSSINVSTLVAEYSKDMCILNVIFGQSQCDVFCDKAFELYGWVIWLSDFFHKAQTEMQL